MEGTNGDDDDDSHIASGVKDLNLHNNNQEVTPTQTAAVSARSTRSTLTTTTTTTIAPTPTPTPTQAIIICDAWYGFPKQARPRKERINAVAKQLYNFISWRIDYLNLKLKLEGGLEMEGKRKSEHGTGTRTGTGTGTGTENVLLSQSICHMYVIGATEDIHAIQTRVDQLLRPSTSASTKTSISTVEDSKSISQTHAYEYEYMPGETLESLVHKLSSTSTSTSMSMSMSTMTRADGHTNAMKSKPSIHTNNNVNVNANNNINANAIYLSPDAEDTLSASYPPPSIVIVGMLVDRKVQTHRSKQRVEALTLVGDNSGGDSGGNSTGGSGDGNSNDGDGDFVKVQVKAGRLPLDVLNVSDLTTNEPLNIDTVMEMMQRWWFHSYNYEYKYEYEYKYKYEFQHDITQEQNQTQKQKQKQERAIDEEEEEEEEEKEVKRIQQKQKMKMKQRKLHFRDAAARAMLTHRQRHPNRTIHGTSAR